MKRLNLNKLKFDKNQTDKAVVFGVPSQAESSFGTIEKMVESSLEIEFGKDFTKQPGFDKMVSKISAVIAQDPELSRDAQIIINKLKSDDQKNQQPYHNPSRTHRRSH